MSNPNDDFDPTPNAYLKDDPSTNPRWAIDSTALTKALLVAALSALQIFLESFTHEMDMRAPRRFTKPR